MNANELADAMEIRASIRRQATSRKSVQEGANDRLADQLEQAATMLRQQQAEIEALKRQAMAKENSIYALDMMIAQFEDKFGDYEKVINGNYVKVRPHEFIAAVTGKEHIVGQPIMYAEWPMRDDE